MRWATRRGCHVDRTACAWLVTRFLDPEAEFSFFGDPAEAPEGAELFDVAGARLSHRGDDCSFETFLVEYEHLGRDATLREIAEIIHDADLLDERYGRPEAEGLDAIIRGMQLASPDDHALLRQTGPVFDGLYAYLSREAP
ncbi:chromate resistance protein [Rubrobacter marinus]|uniref:Chromate resistance protein n=1 Tax=Rubrobacter marinus TaxID=2653852 RepID=A0A6G8Q087_9ACTN|nr:chromate resistance protein ChrB domain-containing protein [Rubrobacter marinus]QIN79840.1 chromate resistance protein [Rubrobacter marinus]